MQEDPAYLEMVKRSYILQKFPDLEIPLVKKQASFKHQLATTLTLATCIHLALYPFDTIKTRLIAKSKFSDIARFNQNNVNQLTTYLGIARGYGSIMIGNLCHMIIGRENLVAAAGLEGFLKTWIDMSKISKQMGNNKGDIEIMKKSFLPCAFFGIMRDIIFRTIYYKLSTYLHNKYLSNSRFYDQRKRLNNLFYSVIAATIISQPFEVCFVKAASQRSLKFENILKIPAQIVKEQGFGKLMIGGLWARLIYNVLSTTLLANTYQPFLEAAMQAF